jgi:hypothetical protein
VLEIPTTSREGGISYLLRKQIFSFINTQKIRRKRSEGKVFDKKIQAGKHKGIVSLREKGNFLRGLNGIEQNFYGIFLRGGGVEPDLTNKVVQN